MEPFIVKHVAPGLYRVIQSEESPKGRHNSPCNRSLSPTMGRLLVGFRIGGRVIAAGTAFRKYLMCHNKWALVRAQGATETMTAVRTRQAHHVKDITRSKIRPPTVLSTLSTQYSFARFASRKVRVDPQYVNSLKRRQIEICV